MAITITIPRVLSEAVKKLADKRDCGNVSAVIRGTLYKEAEVVELMALQEDAAARIAEAESRTTKYKISKFRPKKKPGAK